MVFTVLFPSPNLFCRTRGRRRSSESLGAGIRKVSRLPAQYQVSPLRRLRHRGNWATSARFDPESMQRGRRHPDGSVVQQILTPTADPMFPFTGSIGGPKWGVDAKVRPEPGLLALRKALGFYANIRPANIASESLLEYSPLRSDIVRGVNIIIVRELIGGLYFGERKEQGVKPDVDTAWDMMTYSVQEVQRITRVAAQIALSFDPPMDIHSIDKANVLATSRMWRRVVTETIQKEYPQLKVDHQFIDAASMVLVANPRKLNGVVLTENLFGDM